MDLDSVLYVTSMGSEYTLRNHLKVESVVCMKCLTGSCNSSSDILSPFKNNKIHLSQSVSFNFNTVNFIYSYILSNKNLE